MAHSEQSTHLFLSDHKGRVRIENGMSTIIPYAQRTSWADRLRRLGFYFGYSMYAPLKPENWNALMNETQNPTKDQHGTHILVFRAHK